MRAARAQVRRWQLGKVRLACRAESAGRNCVICECQPGTGILRNRRRAGTGGAISDIVKVPLLNFCRGGDPRLPHLAAALAIPLLREKEEGLLLLDRTADGVAVVVAAQIILFSAS